jgi:hypothetical protein
MRRILGLLLISVAPAAWAGSITENTGTAAFINVVQVNGSVTRIDQTSGTHDSFLQNSVAIPALGTGLFDYDVTAIAESGLVGVASSLDVDGLLRKIPIELIR